MKLINRGFLLIMVAFGCSWIWSMVALHRQVAADDEFYAKEVAPRIEATKRQSEAFERAMKKRQHGEKVPLPEIGTTNLAPLNNWVDRLRARNDLVSLRGNSLLGFQATLVVWTISLIVQGTASRRRWESPNRLPISTAGRLIGDLISSGSVFVAKEQGCVEAKQVEIDGSRKTVVFRNFTFVTSFVGNPKRELTEVPFCNLIVGTMYFNRGRSSLKLRTSQGTVFIFDKIQPFNELASLLQDAAEFNRTIPDRFNDALAREPRVHTPWYGWAIIAIAAALVGTAFWWFVIRT